VAPGDLPSRVRPWLRAARPGSVLVQLRDVQLCGRTRLALAKILRELTHESQQGLSINDRVDIAALVGADGVHLSRRSITPEEARQLLPGAFLSAPWHPPELMPEGVGAVLASPVLAPRKGRAAIGLQGLGSAVKRAHRSAEPPLVFALGGIAEDNAGACLAAGAQGVAAIGAIWSARDPLPLLAALGIAR
jgi:thiamine-phosphate pyrophosphorylase